MPKDTELDRLKTARDSAFERKQAAWQAQDQAWKRRSSARDSLARTREDKQRAYEIQQAAWEYLQSVRNRNGPRIDQLNREQETAYQRMRDSFDRASAAHASRDGASARSYADDGHAYKAESQRAVAERRRLVEEIRDAKSRHDATKPGFQRAKDAHARAQADFNSAKAEHERLKSAFQTAKAVFERAKQAFETRLASVKSANEQRRSEKRRLAERAGVPSEYLDDVWVTTKPDGTVHFYFGGVGSPDGPGHGHYVMETSGHISYRRNSFDPHGAHNHTDHREASESEMTQIAQGAAAHAFTSKREIQFQDRQYTVKVHVGFSRDHRANTTDVIVAVRHNSDEHFHLVIDEYGNVVFSEWRKNH